VPLRCGGAITASKLPDAQAAQESADSLMPTLLAGAHFIMHSAGWLEGGLVMSYEKFMLDVDHLGMMHVFAKGLNLDDNALALDAFREVGPGSHFLGCTHTMRNYETAYYRPALADSDSFEQWQERGSQSAEQRAHRAWQETLAAYQPPPLDPAIDEALQEFMQRRKSAVADAWY
jgi:trimethylamine--corrinoid protein Co-methyltransferase